VISDPVLLSQIELNSNIYIYIYIYIYILCPIKVEGSVSGSYAVVGFCGVGSETEHMY
jgi:hypothetical protein